MRKYLFITFITLAAAPPVLAQEAISAQPVDFTQLLPAALALLLPVGLLLLISSALPEEKAPAGAINLLVVWSLAALAYFGLGFAFQFGGIAQVSPDPDLRGLYWEWYPLDQSVDVEVARLWGVIALRGWGLSGEAATPGALRLFLSHLSLAGVAAMIPAGALLYRDRPVAAALTGLLMGGLIYPVAGNWVWGGGWLSHLGTSLGLGHGVVDFGGASLVFLTGSAAALVALTLLRPAIPPALQPATPPRPAVRVKVEGRLTVYDDDDDKLPRPAGASLPEFTPMPSAYLPILSLLGGGLMILGWFGLTTGVHIPLAVNFIPAQAAAAGLLAALAGALTAAGYSWFTTGAFNPLMASRGLAAGLVIATGGAPFTPIWVSVTAGLLMGLALPPLVYLFDRRLRLADGLGTIAAYGVSALLSLLLVALLADGRAGQGWNGVGPADYLNVAGQGVSGLLVAPGFVPDWRGQLQAQLVGSGVILLWTFLISYLLFQAVIVVTKARTGQRSAPAPARPISSSQPAGGNELDDRPEHPGLADSSWPPL